MAIFSKASVNSEDPQQRIKAIDKLDANLDKSILLELLINDSEVAVKEAILSKLSDPLILTENLKHLTTNMQMAACARIVNLLQIDLVNANIKKQTLEKVANLLKDIPYEASEDKIPALILVTFIFDSLLKECEDLNNSLLIIELIKNLDLSESEIQSWFTKIAVTSSQAEIRIKAIELVEDEKNLQKIVDFVKKHKKEKKLAQEKLQKIKQIKLENQELEEKCTKLALATRELSLSPFDSLFVNRYEYLKKSWLEISYKATFKDKQLYETCICDIEAKISAEEQIKFAAEESRQQLNASKQCLEITDELLLEIKNPLNIENVYLNSVLLKLNDLEAQFRHLPNQDQELTQKFNQNIANLRKNIQSLLDFLEQELEIANLLAKDDPDYLSDLENLLKNLNLNPEFKEIEPIKSVFTKLYSLKKNSKKILNTRTKNLDKNSLAQLEKSLKRLDCLLQEGQLKAAIKESHLIRSEFDIEDNHLLDKQKARFTNLNRRLTELKKWQDSIARPKRLEICEQLEFLAQDLTMDLRIKAEKVKQLQAHWQELGADGQSKSLWERFKKASQEAFAPCKAQITSDAQKKQFNAEQKRVICNELEFLAAEDFASIKTNDYFNILTEVKKQWNLYNPISNKDFNILQPKYNLLLKEIATKREEVTKKLRQQKLEILDKSQDLLNSETASLADFKNLKNQWFAIDYLPRKEEKQKFTIFMARMDKFLVKTQDKNHQLQVAKKQEEDKILQLVKELTPKLTLTNLEEFKTKYKEFEQSIKNIDAKFKQNLHKTTMALREKAKKLDLWQSFTSAEKFSNNFTSMNLPKISASEILAKLDLINKTSKLSESEQLKLQITRLKDRKNLNIKDDFAEVNMLAAAWQKLPQEEQEALATDFSQALAGFCLTE